MNVTSKSKANRFRSRFSMRVSRTRTNRSATSLRPSRRTTCPSNSRQSIHGSQRRTTINGLPVFRPSALPSSNDRSQPCRPASRSAWREPLSWALPGLSPRTNIPTTKRTSFFINRSPSRRTGPHYPNYNTARGPRVRRSWYWRSNRARTLRPDRLAAAFAGANADAILQRQNEDLAVADRARVAGAGGVDDGLDGRFDEGVVHRDLQLQLGQQTHLKLGAAVDLGVAALPAAAAHIAHRHQVHVPFVEGRLNSFE